MTPGSSVRDQLARFAQFRLKFLHLRLEFVKAYPDSPILDPLHGIEAGADRPDDCAKLRAAPVEALPTRREVFLNYFAKHSTVFVQLDFKGRT